MKTKNLLFIGGLGSAGGKARKIANCLTQNKVEFKMNKKTPDYINDNSSSILSEIQNLLDNNYDYIFASSTGCLFALHALNNSDITKQISINLINPLLHLSEEKKAEKEKAFLNTVLPLMKQLHNSNFDKNNFQFNFYLSKNDEAIGSQEPTIKQLEFPENTSIHYFNDGHRMGESTDEIIKLTNIN